MSIAQINKPVLIPTLKEYLEKMSNIYKSALQFDLDVMRVKNKVFRILKVYYCISTIFEDENYHEIKYQPNPKKWFSIEGLKVEEVS